MRQVQRLCMKGPCLALPVLTLVRPFGHHLSPESVGIALEIPENELWEMGLMGVSVILPASGPREHCIL